MLLMISLQELVQHLMQYTAEGCNLDCLHPVQEVLDALCGGKKGQFAVEMENWFESYSDTRGIKAKAFCPMSSFAPHLHIICI